MDLLPTDEQEEIIASVRAVLADRQMIGEPLSDDLWHAAVEQGWFALGLPEDLGGVGYGLAEEALVFTEIGRHASPGPFLATALAARIAAEGGATDLANRLIGGETRACLAESEGNGRRFIDSERAAVAVVLDDQFSVIELPTDLEPDPALDTLTTLATSQSESSVLAASADPDIVRRQATVLGAAQLVGIAKATMAQSVDYGMDRQQFGQPVGSFQAVKHRCADMAVRADVAESQVRWAAVASDNGQADADFHAEAAAVVATNAAIENAQWNIQNHGGIGFTWEHTAHRYLTRARMWSTMLGGLRAHQARLLAADSGT
jgi:alkylation response protein AidB-like acyl-CoA dehydrogenase